MRIDIPKIYEENIMGFIHQNGDIIFKYKAGVRTKSWTI